MRRAAIATPTSDVTRPRALAMAVLLGAVAAGAVAFASDSQPGPIARPHVKSGLSCDSCHASAASPDGPKAACTNCHAGHASSRAGHRAAKIGCVTCHPAHGDFQGVTLSKSGEFVRFGGSAESRGALAHPAVDATVPLVSLAVCGRCHDLDSLRDPIAACKSKNTNANLCFDEHGKSETRWAAWDAAREVASTTPWVKEENPPHRPGVWLAASAGFVALGLAAFGAISRRKKRPSGPSAPVVAPRRVRLPQIDPQTCLGCYACVDACPFDVLAIERFVAKVVRPTECCGVVLCEQVCPNGSLRITEGEAITTQPLVGVDLQAEGAPGIFLAGDLTGLPLIKNAIRQGRHAAEGARASLPKNFRGDADIAIVGAGPAGLSAALRAKELGARAIVLEQHTLASTIRSFPRAKLVFDQPLNLPIEGDLWLKDATKEELLTHWARLVRVHSIDVREHHRVTSLTRTQGGFEIESNGQTLRVARVVLAIGKRGTPKKLECPVDDESMVSYALADARSFAGQHVLIVGLGDAAMESAVALAHQPQTKVTIAYRGSDFHRGRARNISEVTALAKRGRITMLWKTEIARVRRGRVVFASGDELRCNTVLALLGGIAPRELLAAAGVRYGDDKTSAFFTRMEVL